MSAIRGTEVIQARAHIGIDSTGTGWRVYDNHDIDYWYRMKPFSTLRQALSLYYLRNDPEYRVGELIDASSLYTKLKLRPTLIILPPRFGGNVGLSIEDVISGKMLSSSITGTPFAVTSKFSYLMKISATKKKLIAFRDGITITNAMRNYTCPAFT